MKTLALKTYAKINLSLDVIGKREDGYHEVRMVMHAIDLYDEMRIRLIPAATWKITIKTDKYYIPVDSRNTAYRAADLIQGEFLSERIPCEIRIDIKKNIPVAAGLAGGSSNAAGVLIALNELFELGLSLKVLCDLGSKIGADVPFCLMAMYGKSNKNSQNSEMINQIEDDLSTAEDKLSEVTDDIKSDEQYSNGVCALAEGIGEKLTPLNSLDVWVLLVKLPISVSTPEVYAALDNISGYDHPDTQILLEGLKSKNLQKIKAGMVNVLENVTLNKHPNIAEIKREMQKLAPDTTLMSGSGPTLFSIFNDKKHAKAAYNSMKKIEAERYHVILTKTLK